MTPPRLDSLTRDQLLEEVRRLRKAETDLEVVKTAAWMFNEAVSLLRDARSYVPEATSIQQEIDEEPPAIQAALEALARVASR